MVSADHPALYAMWSTTPGLTIRKADSREGFRLFLKRNPGLSFVVETKEQIIGGILGGQDGRFGSIHHLVVLPAFRNQGIGKQLVEMCLKQFRSAGLERCHIFINRDNPTGLEYWKAFGWVERTDLSMATYILED